MVADLSKATSPLLRVQVYVPASADEILVMDSCPGTDVLNLMSVELMAVEFSVQVESGSGFPSMLVKAIRVMLVPATKYNEDILTAIALGSTVVYMYNNNIINPNNNNIITLCIILKVNIHIVVDC